MDNSVSRLYLQTGTIIVGIAILGGLAAYFAGAEPLLLGIVFGTAVITGVVLFSTLNRTLVAPLFEQARQVSEGKADLSQLSPAIRQLAQGYQAGLTISDLLSDKTNSNAIAAAEVSFSADNLRSKITVQVDEITQIDENSQRITATVQESADQAARAAELAMHAKDTCQQGQNSLGLALQKIELLNEQSSETLLLIEQLNEKSAKIQSVTKVIEEIAEQTNLLALNAAIEAARAGDHGRGFAVVADEVRQLAARTAGATGEVETIVDEIQSETRLVVDRITALSQNVSEGSTIMATVSDQLGGVSNQAMSVEEQVSIIAAGAASNQESLMMISGSIQKIRAEIIASEEEVQQLANQASSLVEVAEVSSAVLAEHTDANYHKSFYEVAREYADRIQALFEKEISSGSLSESDLFDRDYQPIANTNPQKYATRYDQFTDHALPAIQEAALNSTEGMVYAIATDPAGYVPTHNNQFANAPVGDYQTDLVKSRSKRLFNDRTGARCGSHTERMLLQTYKRDTGEIMHDLSVPIHVNGRHWGGFRIGYWPKKH